MEERQIWYVHGSEDVMGRIKYNLFISVQTARDINSHTLCMKYKSRHYRLLTYGMKYVGKRDQI